MDEITNLSGARLRNFFISLCKRAKAADEKKKQKAEIGRHLERIRAISIEKGVSRKIIEDELGMLSSKVDRLLDKERFIETRQESEENLLRKLQSRVEELGITPLPQPKAVEEFHKIAGTLQENISRIKVLTQEAAEEEKQRLAQVEQKVSEKMGLTEGEIRQIENKLELLENEYKKLRRTGKEKKRVEKLGSKIKKQKEILKKIKRS